MENLNVASSPTGAQSVMDIGILAPAEIEFYKNPQGFLAMKKGDADFKRVKLSRVLPFAEAQRYIAVSDMDSKELGIIRDLAELPDNQRDLALEELSARYYCPEVTAIRSIKEKMGYFYFDVSFGSYKKIFAVKDISRSIKQIDDKSIIITDVDGSRYFIPDVWKIDAKSRRKIEPYLY